MAQLNDAYTSAEQPPALSSSGRSIMYRTCSRHLSSVCLPAISGAPLAELSDSRPAITTTDWWIKISDRYASARTSHLNNYSAPVFLIVQSLASNTMHHRPWSL
jgi:hypothetical protein